MTDLKEALSDLLQAAKGSDTDPVTGCHRPCQTCYRLTQGLIQTLSQADAYLSQALSDLLQIDSGSDAGLVTGWHRLVTDLVTHLLQADTGSDTGPVTGCHRPVTGPVRPVTD